MADRTKITVEASAYIALSCYLLLMPVSWVANALSAMAVHELGHCAAIWACGHTVYEIRIGAYGAKIITQTADHCETLICALAGPAAGMLLALFYRWVPVAALCALIQSLFNLLPIYPFDGGRALGAVRGMVADKSVAKKSVSVYNNAD